MRVAVVVAAMLFCMAGCSRKEIQKGVTNSIGMELIEIPAGKFTMGRPAGEKDRRADEEQVAVTLTKPFGLGKYEVTQVQWKKVMGTASPGLRLLLSLRHC
jgi:formylglycine-generating enzyme required for sulfatase activity